MSDTYSDTYIEDNLPGIVPVLLSDGLYQRFGKRALDLLAVLLIGPMVLPLIGLVWFGAFLNGGSGFYAQPRVGRKGATFRCWKIRTMAVGAEQKLAAMIGSDPEIALEWQTHQKLRRDPRITRLGRFLRASSIDELPQLWNVLIGDMSLIGPRPFTPDQRSIYDANATGQAYYDLRPGLSGLWQVNSRNAGNFQDRVAFDDEYAAQVSLKSDLKIVLKTFIVVLRGTGK